MKRWLEHEEPEGKRRRKPSGKITDWFANPVRALPEKSAPPVQKRPRQMKIDGGVPEECVTLAVVGTRHVVNRDMAFSAMSKFISWLRHKHKKRVETIVSGGATGADTYAQEYAEDNGLRFVLHEPMKSKPSPQRFFDRNQLIANECDYMLALWDGSSRGTRDVVRRALAREAHVYAFFYLDGLPPVDWSDRKISSIK